VRILWNFKGGTYQGPVVTFTQDEAPRVLGVRSEAVDDSLRLLDEAGWLLRDAGARWTRKVRLRPGEDQVRRIVVIGHQDRLSVERTVRGLRYDRRKQTRRLRIG
jgi:hypothetical protein